MEILGIAFATLPYLVAIVASILFVLYVGITLSKPRYLLYPYLLVLFFITGSSYGRLEAVAPSLYSRGAGVLYFPVLLWLLFAAMLWSMVSVSFEKIRRPGCNILSWYFGFFLLILCHVAVGVAIGVPLKEVVSPAGFSNLIWMAVLIILVLNCFKTEGQFVELSRFVVIFGTARALFGLVRWIGFGGDPANAYQNRHGLDIKLTFFDINDSLLCWLALSISAMQLFSGQQRHHRIWRIVLWCAIFSSLLCIVLSFRRTAWIGLLIASVFLLLQLPKKIQVRAVFLAAPIVLSGMVFSAWKRLSQTKGAGGLKGFFFDIQSRDIGAESSRLLELKLVAADFFSNPIVGIGSWGRYSGHDLISWQGGEFGGTFVHSGVLHIALKSGLIGILLCVGIVFSFVRHWKSIADTPLSNSKILAVSGIGGALFFIPDLVIGTPVPQVRSMQMIAFCMALPYLAWRPAEQSSRLLEAGFARKKISGRLVA